MNGSKNKHLIGQRVYVARMGFRVVAAVEGDLIFFTNNSCAHIRHVQLISSGVKV